MAKIPLALFSLWTARFLYPPYSKFMFIDSSFFLHGFGSRAILRSKIDSWFASVVWTLKKIDIDSIVRHSMYLQCADCGMRLAEKGIPSSQQLSGAISPAGQSFDRLKSTSLLFSSYHAPLRDKASAMLRHLLTFPPKFDLFAWEACHVLSGSESQGLQLMTTTLA